MYLSYHLKVRCSCVLNPNVSQSLRTCVCREALQISSGLNINKCRVVHLLCLLYSLSNTIKCTYTSFLAISWSRLGRRLILWLIARLRMCLGRVWKTREFEDFCATAFNMALISAARAWAKVDAGIKRTASEHDKQKKIKEGNTVRKLLKSSRVFIVHQSNDFLR